MPFSAFQKFQLWIAFLFLTCRLWYYQLYHIEWSIWWVQWNFLFWNENEEICPKCGYFFSNNYSGVDSEGRPYDFYQETNHQNHYDGENIKITKKTGNIKSDYVIKTLLSRDRELPQSFTDEELLKTIDNIYGGSIIALLFGFGIPFFIGFICEVFDDASDIEDIFVNAGQHIKYRINILVTLICHLIC